LLSRVILTMQEVEFLGSTRREISSWDSDTRDRVGYQLYRVQQGLDPSDYKPMSSIGTGVREIRIESGGQWRVIYTANFNNVVYVLEAFQKKTGRTPRGVIDNAKARLKAIEGEKV